MKISTLRETARPIAQRAAELTDAEIETLTAELVLLNGYQCGRVLDVRATPQPDVWQVCCVADGAMDALVAYKMDARTGVVTAF